LEAIGVTTNGDGYLFVSKRVAYHDLLICVCL